MSTHNICFRGEIRKYQICFGRPNATFPELCSYSRIEYGLTITTLWANSADDKLIFFLFFPENKI